MYEDIQLAFTVRKAVVGDAREINQLSAELGYPSALEQTESLLSCLLTMPDQAIFVAVFSPPQIAQTESLESNSENQLAGWIQMTKVLHLMEAPIAEVIGLVVADGLRGRGIGKTLLQTGEDWAERNKLSTIWVRSHVGRERAHLFYLQRGYHLNKTQYLFEKRIAID